ncbi:hypothetical protein QP446_09435 [Corynebacterium riegelii]|uniref:hypothetical protein n=1 Tax=Corynebacterium riegelii TaxID=156976 RepID=UPI00254CB9B4|nr:hypothetical protein [Corynebacterium riegelii]MDK7180974.1 hypothetical protein [Corynebacterium riegelii]
MSILEKATITSILVATTLYITISFVSYAGGGFPFLIGAVFIIAMAIAVLLTATSVSAWAHRRARAVDSIGAFIGAWVSTVGVFVAAGAVVFQLFRTGDFWISLFSDLLWVVTTATALLWLGFALLVFSREAVEGR